MFRFARTCLFVLTALAIVVCSDASGAQTKKKTNKKKTTPNKGQVQQPMFGVPATPVAPNTTANGTTPASTASAKEKLVDKDADINVADNAKVQRLQKFDSGLNFVSAGLEDLEDGQKVTLTMVAKGDAEKKDVQNLTGTITKVVDGGKRLMVRFAVPEGKDGPDPSGKECTLVSIRSLASDK